MRFDPDGLVVEPHVVNERLWRLALYAGGVTEFRFYELFFMVSPFKLLDDLEHGIAYLGRYGRQSADAIDQWDVPRFELWVEIISEYIKAESPDVTRNAETEWK